jgi:hypothetical protein
MLDHLKHDTDLTLTTVASIAKQHLLSEVFLVTDFATLLVLGITVKSLERIPFYKPQTLLSGRRLRSPQGWAACRLRRLARADQEGDIKGEREGHTFPEVLSPIGTTLIVVIRSFRKRTGSAGRRRIGTGQRVLTRSSVALLESGLICQRRTEV